VDIENAKIYGLCIERLRHQIGLAKRKNGSAPGPVVLESYCTGDVDEIVDLLELYDMEDHTLEALHEKLGDLALTASMLTQEKLEFDFSEEGHLCLYFRPRQLEGGFFSI
jgi:hypothetical protein